MGNGLLAWWHRRTASCGLVGAALCVVPIAVAALIGFGTSLAGVASGFGALTTGPESTSVSAQTDPTDPSKLNRAVLALASKPGPSVGSNSDGDSTVGGGRGPTGDRTGTGTVGTGGSGGPVGSDGGSGSSTVSAPVGSGGSGSGGGSTSAPSISLPSTGGATDTVNNTVNGVGSTAGGAVDSVNNTLGGANETVNGLLDP
jgi:hypothetical protein